MKGGEKMAAKKTDYMAQIETWFLKLPALPKGGRDTLVRISPWLALIFGILGVVFGVIALIGSTVLTPLLFVGGAHPSGLLLASLIGLVGSVLLLVAYPGLKARKLQGWNMLFWSEVVSLLGAIIAISISGVIVSLIIFYLLYQIKAAYK